MLVWPILKVKDQNSPLDVMVAWDSVSNISQRVHPIRKAIKARGKPGKKPPGYADARLLADADWLERYKLLLTQGRRIQLKYV